MTRSTMTALQVRPLAGCIGAEVTGVDLREPLPGATLDEIGHLLDEHLVVFFPGQALDDSQHLTFARRFGEPFIHPLGRVAGRTSAGVEHIIDSLEHPPYQDKWHTDVSFDPNPPVYGTLRAIDIPSRGGDTVWASMYSAYDALSPVLQELIASLSAVHDMGTATAFASKVGADLVARTRKAFPGAEHPVVGVHPSTGRRYLNVNKEFTARIVGMHPEESAALLRLLTDQATNPNHQVRYSWAPGDLAIWDERVTQHFAVADYLPERREMARVAVGPPAN
ncbi:MAG TPA: TauD/TfdA family dioxygenase [Acidimicrobiales bacterium]|nr:TauD/TfdA family dioxygenase [Acidimicrobiales bacterium]